MDFYDKLEELEAQDILNHAEYQSPSFVNWDSMKSFLLDLVSSYKSGVNKKALIYGDYDVDGLMCIKVMHDGLTALGVQNCDIYNYTQRTHALDTLAVQKAILGRYDYFIVCDTGSSNMELLKRVAQHGTKIIILDHHMTSYSYEDFSESIAIINTTIENRFIEDEKSQFMLSAGALCYTVMRKFCEECGFEVQKQLAAYATVSLYSDCMNMGSYLNRAIYYEAKAIERSELPHLITLFMNEFQIFSARYIGFWFAPRLNALFRSENFNLLNKLVFANLNASEEAELVEIVEDIYFKIRALTKELADIIDIAEYDHFIVGDLQSVEEYYSISEYKLYNYTGLVANMLSDRYGKAAVIYCYTGSEIKGSVRDMFSRDYLSIFSNFCNAGGHTSAFGFHLGVFDLDNFLTSLRYIDQHFQMDDVKNKPFILTMNGIVPDSYLIEDIAKYNEFAGYGLPVVYIKKQVVGTMKEIRTKYNYKYVWGDYTIQSDHSLNFGTYVLLKPIHSLNTKLLVQ